MQRILLSLNLIGLLVLLFSCNGMNKKSETTTPVTSGPPPASSFEGDKLLPSSLSQEQAQARQARVDKVRYELAFELNEEDKYSGVATLKFNLTDNNGDLRVDFFEGTLGEVRIQGEPVEVAYNQRYLMLPAEALKKGENTVVIPFTRPYARDGSGLMWFRDQEDGRVYTYTDLEPYDANRVFPNFDQPDLKATYTMQVQAPKTWQVITSVRESDIKDLENGKREWIFPESERFSTYIWSLHAGPYKMWEDKQAVIPSRLFIRQSLAKYVNPQDWFTVTNQGFNFFNAYFDSPYPFKKYDQVIVPEFNAGAMENVAAVTFSERFVSRGEKSRSEKRAQAYTILHEMAHMWFGNLVTMVWWNDLWLNESFATYMGKLALAEATEFKETWDDFHGTKTWAYWEDQNVTTHPIETSVHSTLEAFANFDGITYGKGASALKQLAFFLGPEKFQKGVQLYFKRHAWSNTELQDFMNALEEGANTDLKAWQEVWLQTAGLNTVQAEFKCDQDKLSSLTLTQGVASGDDRLRPHRLKVGLFNNKKAYESLSVKLEGKTTKVSSAVGKPCPEFVLPNFEDHAYIRVRLDPKSLKNLEGEVSAIKDPLTKRLIWTSLLEDVRDAKLSIYRIGKMALAEIGREDNPLVLEQVLRALHGRSSSSSSILYYWPRQSAQEKKTYDQFVSQLEDALWKRLHEAKADSENQKIFIKSFISTTESAKAQARLLDLLTGKTKLVGLDIDQDRRWEIITQLSRVGHPRAEELIAQEEKRDPSAFGKLAKISARAALPEWTRKQQWLQDFRGDEKAHSYMEQKQAISSLFPRYQGELHQRYGEQFFKDLKFYNETKDPSFVRSFTNLAPLECDTAGTQGPQIKDFLEGNQEQLVAPALKSLRIAAQENERCRDIRQLARRTEGEVSL